MPPDEEWDPCLLDEPLDFGSDGFDDERPGKPELDPPFDWDDECPELEWLLRSGDFELELDPCFECLCLSSRPLLPELESPDLESGVFDEEEDLFSGPDADSAFESENGSLFDSEDLEPLDELLDLGCDGFDDEPEEPALPLEAGEFADDRPHPLDSLFE